MKKLYETGINGRKPEDIGRNCKKQGDKAERNKGQNGKKRGELQRIRKK